ncbi:hypothetical protein BGZ58_002154 [Dissophora ornata]|nr:hypothetical protein BGZ58_002154 [Dissophora ornata]
MMLQETLQKLLHPPPLAVAVLVISVIYLLPQKYRQRILNFLESIVGLDLMMAMEALPSLEQTSGVLLYYKTLVLDPLTRILLGWEHEDNLEGNGVLASQGSGFLNLLPEHRDATRTDLPDRSTITSRAQLQELRNGDANQESILNRSDELQLPEDDIQVTEALLDTMEALQQPLASHKSFRPRAIVSALEESRARDPNASGYRSSIMNREQQDAQELFQMISSALSSEEATIQKLQATRPLLGLDFIKKLLVLAQKPNEHQIKKLDSNPMIGMLASRLSCMQCGYTEAIRHFTFDNLSLSLPSNHSCTIEDCLKQYINLESLHDVVCRKCSLQATLARICSDLKQLDNHQPLRHSIARRRLQQDLDSATGSSSDSYVESGESSSPNDSDDEQITANALRFSTKAERMALKSKLAQQRKVLESAIRSDVERPLQDIKLSKVVSRHCTKQVMMAKSPRVLCLHFIRSQYSNYGTVSKNSCQVNFPEYLDISPFCTTGVLLTQPNFPMSISEQDLERLGSRISPKSQQSDHATSQQQQRQTQRLPGTLYRLQSIVVHYGGHSYGHFIAYRRKPESMLSKVGVVGLGLDPMTTSRAGSLHGSSSRTEDWFRVSDETVESVTLDHVLRSNPYMCLYERVETADEKLSKNSGTATSSLSFQAVELGFRRMLQKKLGIHDDKDDAAGERVKQGGSSLETGRVDFKAITEKEYAERFKGRPRAMSALSRKGPLEHDEDMSDTESIQSHDEDRLWRSFVSSPNSTTPPSPNTGSSDSSAASSSFASPILMQRSKHRSQQTLARLQIQSGSIPDLDLALDTPTMVSSLASPPSPINIPGPSSTVKSAPTQPSSKTRSSKNKSKSKPSGRRRR